jgi:hypothetical protein
MQAAFRNYSPEDKTTMANFSAAYLSGGMVPGEGGYQAEQGMAALAKAVPAGSQVALMRGHASGWLMAYDIARERGSDTRQLYKEQGGLTDDQMRDFDALADALADPDKRRVLDAVNTVLYGFSDLSAKMPTTLGTRLAKARHTQEALKRLSMTGGASPDAGDLFMYDWGMAGLRDIIYGSAQYQELALTDGGAVEKLIQAFEAELPEDGKRLRELHTRDAPALLKAVRALRAKTKLRMEIHGGLPPGIEAGLREVAVDAADYDKVLDLFVANGGNLENLPAGLIDEAEDIHQMGQDLAVWQRSPGIGGATGTPALGFTTKAPEVPLPGLTEQIGQAEQRAGAWEGAPLPARQAAPPAGAPEPAAEPATEPAGAAGISYMIDPLDELSTQVFKRHSRAYRLDTDPSRALQYLSGASFIGQDKMLRGRAKQAYMKSAALSGYGPQAGPPEQTAGAVAGATPSQAEPSEPAFRGPQQPQRPKPAQVAAIQPPAQPGGQSPFERRA